MCSKFYECLQLLQPIQPSSPLVAESCKLLPTGCIILPNSINEPGLTSLVLHLWGPSNFVSKGFKMLWLRGDKSPNIDVLMFGSVDTISNLPIEFFSMKSLALSLKELEVVPVEKRLSWALCMPSIKVSQSNNVFKDFAVECWKSIIGMEDLSILSNEV